MKQKLLHAFTLRMVMLVAMVNAFAPGMSAQSLTFDFEDESAHRPNKSNSYTGENTYSENDITISLKYADAVISGSPLSGSANILCRIAKNTTNSPTVIIGPITNTGYMITGISWNEKSGAAAASNAVSYSTNNSTWTSLRSATACATTKTERTISSLSISNNTFYLKFTITVSSSTNSNRDVQLDDIVITRVAIPAAPTFSVAAGDILKGNSVTLSAEDGTTIYYTTDGTTPTTSSTQYTSAITINAAQTIKAIAVKNGISSTVATAAYTLLKPAAPTFSVAACTFNTAFDMTISGPEGSTLKYTTDGTDPVASGTAVDTDSKTISIPTGSDVTVKAVAIVNDVVSELASVTYTYDAREIPTFSLSATEMTIYVLSDDATITLTTNSDGAVTFASSDNENLDVDNSSNSKEGVLTAIATGDYTVAVSTAATSNYAAANGTVTVHVVKKPTTMTIDDAFDTKDLYTDTDGAIEGTVKFGGTALSPQPTVTYSSSDTGVATIASDGTVAFVAAGTTTLTASFAGNDEYAACEAAYELTLTDSTPQATSVNITFNNSAYGTSFKGTDAAGDGPFNATVNNVSVTVVQGSGTNLFVNDTETRIYAGGTITIAAPTGYYIKSIFITKGSSWSVSADLGTLSTATWTGAAQSVVFTGSARSDFRSAVVTLAETVTVTSAGYTTHVTQQNVSFDDVTAYKATEVADGKIQLSPITTAKLGTPVIIKAAAGTYTLTAIADGDAAEATGNILTASDGKATGDGTTIYALGVGKTGDNAEKVGFYLVADGAVIPSGKAYITVDAGVKSFLPFDLGTTTAVESIAGTGAADAAVYNMAGQRVARPQRGIYISRGRKVVVR